LRKQEINAERRIFIIQKRLQLSNLFTEHVWCVANSSDDTKTTSVGDSGGELGACRYVHSRKEDRVPDLEQIGHRRANLFWEMLELIQA
jgi:hypothetical protein